MGAPLLSKEILITQDPYHESFKANFTNPIKYDYYNQSYLLFFSELIIVEYKVASRITNKPYVMLLYCYIIHQQLIVNLILIRRATILRIALMDASSQDEINN